MSRRHRTSLGLTLVALSLASSSALADDLPLPYTSRPLTLPARMISPEFSSSLVHLQDFLVEGGSNALGLNLGASYGIVDELTVYAHPLTMSIDTSTRADPVVRYGGLRLGGVVRFLHTDTVDVGAQLELGVVGDFRTLYVTSAIPVLFRLGHVVRVDTGVAFTLVFPTTSGGQVVGALATVGPGPLASAGVPIVLSLQAGDWVFVGVSTGFGIASLSERRISDWTFSPLGIFVGGTITTNKQPLADLTASFSFPFFLLGGAGDLPVTQAWMAGVKARFYFQL